MCGICGQLSDRPGAAARPDLLSGMLAAIVHRGPDDEGFYHGERIGLAARRLSVIDLVTGHQPMSNEDGSIWVAMNGEIYNYPELRGRLLQAGHRLATRCDTEALVHLYEDHGLDFVDHLRGMFAFALWDDRRQRLVLGRDRIGKKPLVYAEHNGDFLFASEIKCLLQDRTFPREVNLRALHEYLTYGYVPHPMSIFQAVRKLPPGHILVREQGQTTISRYWSVNYEPKHQASEEDLCEEIRRLVDDAVKVRLLSDVPLGVLLSGGIDSAIVTATMAKLMDEPVKTFNIGYDEESVSELPFARQIAQAFHTDHTETVVRPEAVKMLPRLVWHYDEPFADMSSVPTFIVSEAARQKVTVALNGDGGDEFFGGYQRYIFARNWQRYQQLPAALRSSVLGPLGQRVPGGHPLAEKIRRAGRRIALPPDLLYAAWISFIEEDRKNALYTESMRRATSEWDALEPLARAWRENDATNLLDKMMATDAVTFLPDLLLTKIDIATMAASLEGRSPLLDQHLMEFAARIPSTFKLRGQTTKYILRRAYADVLPAEIVRRKKSGFSVPLQQWFRGDLRSTVYDVLLSPTALQRGYFEPVALRRLVDAHMSGSEVHTREIWALLNLELWHRIFIDDAAREAPGLELLTV